jgi:uncharacterized membrane protein
VKAERIIEWQFGGWPGLPAWIGWTTLVVLALVGVALSAFFYRRTLRTLTRRQQLIFTSLRCGLLLSLLLCLASPARVERIYNSGAGQRPLAILVDRSASMMAPDTRGITRLDSAIRVWKQTETEAVRSFRDLRYFRFGPKPVAVPDLPGALSGTELDLETPLFSSLTQLLQEAPSGGYGGIVTLTDGLDTTDETPEKVSAEALQARCPLYFAVGRNQQASGEKLLVRELNVPAQVLRKSGFDAKMIVEAHAFAPHDVALSLQMNGQPLAATVVHLRAGTNLIPWTVPVHSDEPGLLHLDCQLGVPADEESVSADVQVVPHRQVRVLFYQGALDWGFRFIDTALQRDASFSITGLFSPSLNITQTTAPGGQAPLQELPENSADLQPFHVIVLANAQIDQLSKGQQLALADYVRGGGGLLFLVSDTEAGKTFANTVLEGMLPVIFDAPTQPSADDAAQRQFQAMMHSVGGANFEDESQYVAEIRDQSGAPPLQDFAVTPGARAGKLTALFSGAPGDRSRNMPQFYAYAQVGGIKAGGEVLAVHPSEKTPGNEPRALLVTQRFGQGETATLLTDSLWRWKLSLPSTSHDPEVFWQQLFLALARPDSAETPMRFALQPFAASMGQTCAFRLDGVEGAPPTITAVDPQGNKHNLDTEADTQPGCWLFKLIPTLPGKWRIFAGTNGGSQLETLVRVSNQSHSAELSGLPADVDGLRKLAEATGGSLLNDGVPATWGALQSRESTVIRQHIQPLWDDGRVLAACLGFFVVELLWRRRAKLL